MTTGFEEPWREALAALELDVATAERLLAADHLPDAAALAAARSWRAPELGPLPASLETRARAVLARQLEVADRLAAQAVRSRRQLAVADQVATSAVATERPPVYVDADA